MNRTFGAAGTTAGKHTGAPPVRLRRYDPWDQRFCVSPDGDLFDAVRHGTQSFLSLSSPRTP
jgi:hypothetical protein